MRRFSGEENVAPLPAERIGGLHHSPASGATNRHIKDEINVVARQQECSYRGHAAMCDITLNVCALRRKAMCGPFREIAVTNKKSRVGNRGLLPIGLD